MHTLEMTQAVAVIRDCLDDLSPRQSDALSKRDQWLFEFDTNTLVPGPGVREALETLTLPSQT